MSNQASDDEIDEVLDNIFWLGYKLATTKLDKTPNEHLAEAKETLTDLIRTEKLKLLAEVKERVVGSLEPQSENGLLPDRVDRRNQLRTEQLEVLTTQAQERRDLINQRNQYDDQTISGANNICGTITLHRRLGRQ